MEGIKLKCVFFFSYVSNLKEMSQTETKKVKMTAVSHLKFAIYQKWQNTFVILRQEIDFTITYYLKRGVFASKKSLKPCRDPVVANPASGSTSSCLHHTLFL